MFTCILPNDNQTIQFSIYTLVKAFTYLIGELTPDLKNGLGDSTEEVKKDMKAEVKIREDRIVTLEREEI